MQRLLLFFVFCLCRTALPDNTAAKSLKFLAVPPQTVSTSAVSNVKIGFKVEPGLHVQANPSNPPLIATNVSIHSHKELETFTPKYPVGKTTMVKGLGREISTYEGDFDVQLPVKAKKTTKPGNYKIEGDVRYQACDDRLCYPPQKAPFVVNVIVKK